jgi:hypothetical protein
MSIKQQVEDALFLANNGRYMGALANLMLAVAASARKAFPQGTKSKENPVKDMGDREAFCLFLGGRMRKILFGDFGGADMGKGGMIINFKGKQYDIEYILYKFYRCELVHNGDLPEDIEFQPPQANAGLTVGGGGVEVSIISWGQKMVLDYRWIDLLVKSVMHARCNGEEFGIEHYDLVPVVDGKEEEIKKDIVDGYQITPGLFNILKRAMQSISPSHIQELNDSEVISKFKELVEKEVINPGAIIGLSSYHLTDNNGNLLPFGLDVLRKMGTFYKVVKV